MEKKQKKNTFPRPRKIVKLKKHPSAVAEDKKCKKKLSSEASGPFFSYPELAYRYIKN